MAALTHDEVMERAEAPIWALDSEEFRSRPRYLETWVGGELKTIDLDKIWGETFARWDQWVDADVAADIASAVFDVLYKAAIR